MWFWYSLFSAITGAFSVVINKKILKNVPPSLLTWSLFTLSIPIVLFLALKNGPSKINHLFFLGAFFSSIAFVIAKTLTLEAIKKSFLSKLYPLLSFNSLFTYILGLIILSETINQWALGGVFLIISGAYLLNVEKAKEDIFQPFKILFTNRYSLFFLTAMVLSSLAAVFDKISIINTKPVNPSLTLLTEDIIMSGLLIGYMTYKEKPWLYQLKQNFWSLTLASLIYMAVSLFIMSAFPSGPVALIVSIKKIQILFVLLLSYLFYKDKPGKHIQLAALIMVIGTILIKMA